LLVTFLLVLFAFAALILLTIRLFSIAGERALQSAALSTAFLAVMFTADRLTKVAAESALSETGHIRVIPGVIGYVLVHNTGAAWGIFSGATWLLSIFTALILLVSMFFVYFRRLRSAWLHTALLLVAAGGMGNLYDRVVAGSVTDFLEFLFMDFPIFNLADSCVTVGAVIAVIALLLTKEDTQIFIGEAKPEKAEKPKEGEETT